MNRQRNWILNESWQNRNDGNHFSEFIFPSFPLFSVVLSAFKEQTDGEGRGKVIPLILWWVQFDFQWSITSSGKQWSEATTGVGRGEASTKWKKEISIYQFRPVSSIHSSLVVERTWTSFWYNQTTKTQGGEEKHLATSFGYFCVISLRTKGDSSQTAIYTYSQGLLFIIIARCTQVSSKHFFSHFSKAICYVLPQV